MNRSAVIPTLVVAVLAGCMTPAPKQPGIVVGPPGHEVRLSLWNGTDAPVAISVSIDGKVVHESVLAVATYAPPLDEVGGGTFLLSAGPHSVLVQDRTRNIRKQLEIAATQNVELEIELNRDGISLFTNADGPRVIF